MFDMQVRDVSNEQEICRKKIEAVQVSQRSCENKKCVSLPGKHHTALPFCISELICHYLRFRSLRSSNAHLLAITSYFSSWAFSVFAPSTWNSLPVHIHSIDIHSVDKLSTFKRQLKSHVFQPAFTV